jgi:hypothetical protein
MEIFKGLRHATLLLGRCKLIAEPVEIVPQRGEAHNRELLRHDEKITLRLTACASSVLETALLS